MTFDRIAAHPVPRCSVPDCRLDRAAHARRAEYLERTYGPDSYAVLDFEAEHAEVVTCTRCGETERAGLVDAAGVCEECISLEGIEATYPGEAERLEPPPSYYRALEEQDRRAAERRGQELPMPWGTPDADDDTRYFCGRCWRSGDETGWHPFDVPPCDPVTAEERLGPGA